VYLVIALSPSIFLLTIRKLLLWLVYNAADQANIDDNKGETRREKEEKRSVTVRGEEEAVEKGEMVKGREKRRREE